MRIKDIYFRIHQFIRYKRSAVGAHALHSPFVFTLYTQIISKSARHYNNKIETLRKALYKNHDLIETTEFKNQTVILKSISNIAKTSLSRRKFSAFLYLLANHLRVDSILETGTSLGINTLYLAQSSSKSVTTIEGSTVLADLALRNFHHLQVSKIELINANLYDCLEQQIVRNQPDFYFLDADHRSSSIAFCIDLILRHTPNAKCVVIHDIYWSKDMMEIWQELIQDPRFPLTIDIYQAGILFPNMEMEKQHFTLHF